jgi:hypothetical protein
MNTSAATKCPWSASANTLPPIPYAGIWTAKTLREPARIRRRRNGSGKRTGKVFAPVQASVRNDAGQVVEQCWFDIPIHFPHMAIDAFVVMPNHVHGIIVLVGPDDAG